MALPPNRHPYTLFEDHTIVQCLIDKNWFSKVRGNQVWQLMEQSNICPNRSYQSLRNRFLRTIQPRLLQDYGDLLEKNHVRLPNFLRNSSNRPGNSRVDPFLPRRAALEVVVTATVRQEKAAGSPSAALEEIHSTSPIIIRIHESPSGSEDSGCRSSQFHGASPQRNGNDNDRSSSDSEDLFLSEQWDDVQNQTLSLKSTTT